MKIIIIIFLNIQKIIKKFISKNRNAILYYLIFQIEMIYLRIRIMLKHYRNKII